MCFHSMGWIFFVLYQLFSNRGCIRDNYHFQFHRRGWCHKVWHQYVCPTPTNFLYSYKVFCVFTSTWQYTWNGKLIFHCKTHNHPKLRTMYDSDLTHRRTFWFNPIYPRLLAWWYLSSRERLPWRMACKFVCESAVCTTPKTAPP